MFSKSEKFVLFILAFIQFSHIVDFMILMPLGPQLMRLFEIGPDRFGLLVSSYTFAAGVTGLLSALVVDRFDRKTSLLFFFIGFCIGTLACAFAWDYWSLLGARVIAGAFGGVLGSLVLSIVADLINYERRGSAMGYVMMAFSLASVFGVPFSLYLANHYQWRAPFIFLAVLSFLLTFLLIKYLPSMKNHLTQGKRSTFEAYSFIFQSPNQVKALLFIGLLVFGQFIIIPFISPSLVANAGLSEAQLPLIYLAGGICSIISNPWIGKLSDRFGKHKVFSISALFSLVPLVLITNLGPQSLPVILFLVAFFFVCMGGRMIPAMAMVSNTASLQKRGSFMSVISSVQQFSCAIAAFIAGQIVTKDSSGHLLHYERAGYVALLFSLIAIAIAWQVRTEPSAVVP
jgi:predicted MFS family arabinose efflux permease